MTWDGEPQSDRRTPTEHLTQTWELKEVSPKEVMVRLISQDEYKHSDLREGSYPDAYIL